MENLSEEFLASVNGTRFTSIQGQHLASVGTTWPDVSSVGIVTAWNPNFQAAKADQNAEANRVLQRLLDERGHRFEEIHAWHPDESAFEHSFAISELSQEEARELCLRFQQGGFFWSAPGGPIQLFLI